MDTEKTRRFALVLLVALVAMVLLPASAFAKKAGGSAVPGGISILTIFERDVWESDDTSAQAKVLPEESNHTFHTGTDEDWFKFTAETTGTPYVLETQYVSAPPAMWDTEMTIYAVDAGVPSGLVQLWNQDDSRVWAAYGSTAYFEAPAPGTYYVKVEPLSDDQRGFYKTFVYEGIGRRVAGANRYATAAALSKTMYPESPNGAWGTDATPNGVIVVNGTLYADALAAGAWGAMRPDNGEPYPLLLTTKDTLPTVTGNEIERLAVSQYWADTEFVVYVVGGPSVVSDAQLKAIGKLEYVTDVVRVSGTNRYATAAAVASMTIDIGNPTTVVLSSGAGWADGVSAGPLCGAMGAPMLLSKMETLTAETSTWLLDHPTVTEVIIVGGASVIDADVAAALAAAPYNMTVTRLAGRNRYETAYEIASFGVGEGWLDPSGFTLVTGTNFPDGLAAGPFSMLTDSGFDPGPILLTKKTELGQSVYDYYADWASSARPSYAVGGTLAVSDPVFRDFLDLWMMPF